MSKAKDDYQGAKNFAARCQNLAHAWQKVQEDRLSKRRGMLKAFGGGYDLPARTNWKHTLNLISRGVGAIVPYLVEGNPRILVETRIANYRPWAYTTQLALNFFMQKMDLANNVLIPGALNSMFGAAIARTDFYYDRLISLEDEQIKLGTPWVELIDDSNYIGDVSAKRRADFAFEGDVYQLPTEYAKDFFAGKDKHGNEIADYISPDSTLKSNISNADLDRPDVDFNKMALREYTTFIDLYIRDENTIITIMPKGKKAKILREREWEGPGDGPYDYLGYKFAPQQTVPIPPAWEWQYMDETVNILVNKMRELAENQKDVIAFGADAVEDMKKIVSAENLGTVQVSNVESIKPISLNGIKDSSNWDWVNFMLQEQTKQGANPDVLGGRGASAPTLGQEQIIYNNATRIVNNYYNRYQDWVNGIVKKLAWAFWTDPTVHVPVLKDIPGVGQLPAVFSSVDKVGDFYDFAFNIVPYSTQRTSPEMQYAKVLQFMNQWLLPMLPIAQAQGAQLDVPTATQILADYAGIENFNQYFKTAIPNQLDSVPYQMQPTGTGQQNDSAGATPTSRLANMDQQQQQAGFGGASNVMENMNAIG